MLHSVSTLLAEREEILTRVRLAMQNVTNVMHGAAHGTE